jgi:hypothetical protein
VVSAKRVVVALLELLEEDRSTVVEEVELWRLRPPAPGPVTDANAPPVAVVYPPGAAAPSLLPCDR